MAKTVSKSSLQKTKRYKDGSTASFTKVANQAGKKQKKLLGCYGLFSFWHWI